MVELRCNNCKRVFQYSGDEKFYASCPQCNAQVPIARPRNYGKNNPDIWTWQIQKKITSQVTNEVVGKFFQAQRDVELIQNELIQRTIFSPALQEDLQESPQLRELFTDLFVK